MKNPKQQAGFTLMEIVVATTIFSVVAVAMTSLFNYTLKINRRTEAIRQAAQGMRTFVEGLTKQIRNGQIYYGINPDGTAAAANSAACPAGNPGGRYYHIDNSTVKENRIRIISTEGEDICIFLANASNSYVGSGVFSGTNLVMQKALSTGPVIQSLNPANFYVDQMALFIRPICDPYHACSYYSSGLPKIQPMASLYLKLRVKLSTGEQVSFNYQTTVSNNKYDIPNQ